MNIMNSFRVTDKKLDRLWDSIINYREAKSKICGLSLSPFEVDILYDAYAAYKTKSYLGFLQQDIVSVLDKLKLPYKKEGIGWRIN